MVAGGGGGLVTVTVTVSAYNVAMTPPNTTGIGYALVVNCDQNGVYVA